MAQLPNFCCGAQAEFASITSDLSRELEKAEQLIVTTQSQLANEQACSQSLAMALLEARGSNEVGSPLFVAFAIGWAQAPLIVRQQPTSLEVSLFSWFIIQYKLFKSTWLIVFCLSFLQEQMAELTAQLAAQSERACGAQAQADIKASLLADERALSSSLAQEKRALKRRFACQVDHPPIALLFAHTVGDICSADVCPAVFWSLQTDIAFGTGCHLCTASAHA